MKHSPYLLTNLNPQPIVIMLCLVASVQVWIKGYFPRIQLVVQGRRNRSGCSGLGWTSFSQGKSKIPFLQKASNKQKY